jgi:hypothetical protein
MVRPGQLLGTSRQLIVVYMIGTAAWDCCAGSGGPVQAMLACTSERGFDERHTMVAACLLCVLLASGWLYSKACLWGCTQPQVWLVCACNVTVVSGFLLQRGCCQCCCLTISCTSWHIGSLCASRHIKADRAGCRNHTCSLAGSHNTSCPPNTTQTEGHTEVHILCCVFSHRCATVRRLGKVRSHSDKAGYSWVVIYAMCGLSRSSQAKSTAAAVDGVRNSVLRCTIQLLKFHTHTMVCYCSPQCPALTTHCS